MEHAEYSGDIGTTIRNLRKASGASQWEVIARVKKNVGQSISQPKLSLFEAGHRGLSSDELDAVGEAIEDAIVDNWESIRNRAELIDVLADWLTFQQQHHLRSNDSDGDGATPPLPEASSSRVRLFGVSCGDVIPVTKDNIWKRIRSVRMAILDKKIHEMDDRLSILKARYCELDREAARELGEDEAEIEESGQ